MSQKKWSKAEEYIFSYLCIKQYVIPSLTVEEFLNFAHKSLPRISKSSLKAKLSNVKHLLDTKQISNTIPLKPLKNFSKANEDAINDYITENLKGDCLIAVGDEDLIKIHFHTNEPWELLKYAASIGEIYDVVVENMERQEMGLQG